MSNRAISMLILLMVFLHLNFIEGNERTLISNSKRCQKIKNDQNTFQCFITYQCGFVERMMFQFDVLNLKCTSYLYIHDGVQLENLMEPLYNFSCADTPESVGNNYSKTNILTLNYIFDGTDRDSLEFQFRFLVFNETKYECTQFRCQSDHLCIYETLVCDGFKDCVDGSDESNCSETVVKDLDLAPTEFSTTTSNNTQNMFFLIPNIETCPFLKEIENVNKYECMLVVEKESFTEKLMLRFKFLNLTCNNYIYIYDSGNMEDPTYVFSCNDSADSVGVIYSQDGTISLKYEFEELTINLEYYGIFTSFNRSKNCMEFRCRSDEICINSKLRCDGFEHCIDGSDEEECNSGMINNETTDLTNETEILPTESIFSITSKEEEGTKHHFTNRGYVTKQDTILGVVLLIMYLTSS